MAEKENTNLDSLFLELGGCGRFQIIVCSALFVTAFPLFFSLYFMVFGIYNPGWACLDNVTVTNHNLMDTASEWTLPWTNRTEYDDDEFFVDGNSSCQLFEACRDVRFNPVASTIVTQFELVCSKSWIASFLISILMAGYGFGCLFMGIVGDKFGRKVTIQISIFFQIILNFVSIFSVSWQMFAVFQFLLGFVGSFTSLFMVLSNELVPHNWRMKVSSLPCWTFGVAAFSLSAMLVHDWKALRFITGVLSVVIFIMLFWVPKSLRFLSAKGQKEQFLHVTKKIAKWNKKEMPPDTQVSLIMHRNTDMSKKKTPYTVLSLFRKGYRLKTCVLGFSFFCTDLTYYAISYGISSLPGNIYQNMLIITLSELPSNVVAAVSGNFAGRRMSSLTFLTTSALFLVAVSVFDLVLPDGKRAILVLVAVVVAKIFLNAGWFAITTAAMENFPTVVRSIITSFIRTLTVLGGMLAPYLIPTSTSTFYISYLVMAALIALCGVLILLLPETKGVPLLNTWDTGSEENDICDGCGLKKTSCGCSCRAEMKNEIV